MITQAIQVWRRDPLRQISLGLAAVGAIDAAYLTWVKLAKVTVLCTGVGGCEAVSTSQYSEINGVPVAALGLSFYLAVFVLLALESRSSLVAAYGPLLVFGLTLSGVLYSAYLTYVQIVLIGAICPYCVLSAGVETGLFVLSAVRARHVLIS